MCFFQVLFGTADGQVIVMDCHGRMLAHVLLHESDGILNMSWNYPSFLVEDSSESDTDSDDYSPPQGRVLCAPFCFSFAGAHEDISNARVLSRGTKPAGWVATVSSSGRAGSWCGRVGLFPALPPALLQVIPHLCCSASVCTNEITTQSSISFQ